MVTMMEYENSSLLSSPTGNIYSIDHHHMQIPWLNFLTAQSIPEETDGSEYSKYDHDDSGCSSSDDDEEEEEEDTYVVLEVQRPRSILRETYFKFADIQHMKYNEVVQPLVIETPLKRNAMEYYIEPLIIPNEHVIIMNLPSFIKIAPIEKQKNSMISINSIENKSPLIEGEQSNEFTHIYLKKIHPTNLSEISLTTGLNPLNRSSILRLSRKRYRAIQSEYYPYQNEPSLYQMKYFDGRPTLIDLNALETYENFHQINSSNLSTSLTYRKRILNRLQNIFRLSSFNFMHSRKMKKTAC